MLPNREQKTDEGLTGRIIFDDVGRRNDFYMEVVELSLSYELKKIANWKLGTGVTSTRSQVQKDQEISNLLQNKTIVVTARYGAPHLIVK